jgi:hypothetical protein
VQPFVTAGLSCSGFAGNDGDMAAIVVPVGAGVERMIAQHQGGREGSYRPVFSPKISTPLTGRRTRTRRAAIPGDHRASAAF